MGVVVFTSRKLRVVEFNESGGKVQRTYVRENSHKSESAEAIHHSSHTNLRLGLSLLRHVAWRLPNAWIHAWGLRWSVLWLIRSTCFMSMFRWVSFCTMFFESSKFCLNFTSWLFEKALQSEEGFPCKKQLGHMSCVKNGTKVSALDL